MRKSRLPVCFVLLIVLAPLALRAQLHVRKLSRTTNSVTLEVTIPTPSFDTTTSHRLSLRHFAQQIMSDDPLASIVLPLRLSKYATVSVISHDDKTIELKSALTQRKSFKATHRGVGYAQLSYAGKLHAADISKLEIGLFDQASATTLKYSSRIVLKISDPQGLPQSAVTDLAEPYHVSTSVFKQRLGATASSGRGMHVLSDSDVQQSPGIQSDDGNVYRMYIRQTGIYHLTFADLQSYGLDPHAIDPATLRIVNHGQQVPLFMFDHQDGRFDENDYFEFYGEEKRYEGPGTLGDCYYDPDTKDNVYFLVWGTHNSPIPAGGVKRMVEESGDIRTLTRHQTIGDSGYVDLRDSAFWAITHIEQDNVHDDLDISDVDQRSDLRDHEFMAIVGTGPYMPGSYTTKAIVPFADVRENKPILVRAAMHGISHFDPGATDPKGIELPNVADEDVASISVNNHEVLHGTWDSQTFKMLTSDSENVTPTAQYLRGDNTPIDITVAQRKQTDVNGCRFALNWIEIAYNRKYQAFQDSLTFRIPRYDGSGLYQFTLENFSRTDVSVYRKGISKISNVVITSNPDVPRSTKAIFQLHVASDQDEFVAVTEANKLKPFNFAKDDFAGLRSPTNSGEYLIITNKDHLPKGNKGARVPMQDLADYRASTNHVTTKIIDVANIYDEFRYGARSANAIKDFLNYAYRKWQNPPKYVLLVGVTHMGDGDPKQYQPNDQTPTPYIQAYLEGNVAADPWYTMLDGDDLIPDILLGRLGTVDVAGDAHYVAKVKDYEADLTKPGFWKNRAYFIGAGGSFDTDIDGVVQEALPNRVSVARQTTVKSSPYHGTNNTLVDTINQGVAFVGYFGHGGNAIWDDPLDSTGRPVLDNSDITRFHNSGHYPIILSMTCFTAGYDGPSIGILNTFQNAQFSGSIACMGTTSFGWQQNDQHLALAVVPHLFDSVGGSVAERVFSGKIDFIMRSLPGDLIPPTLMYAYHYLGDPLLASHPPTDHVDLSLSTRTIASGGAVQLTGTSTLVNGTASIELVNDKLSQLAPAHVLTVGISNGKFSATDNLPNINLPHASYRVTAFENGSARYGATAEDVTITDSRVTEANFSPRPLPVGASVDFSAAVQTPQTIVGVFDTIQIYSQNASGQVTVQMLNGVMSQNGDKYRVTIPAGQLSAGDKIVGRVTLVTSTGSVQSDTAYVIVGAAADPSVLRDNAHRSLSGHYIATSTGLAWQDHVYNWGAASITATTVSLIDLKTNAVLGNAVVSNIPPHGQAVVTIPLLIQSLDSAIYVLATTPDVGSSALNLRDSTLTNDTTLTAPFAGAAAYRKGAGTNATFNGNEVALIIPGTAESNITNDVIRVDRRYDTIRTIQPDIHFMPMFSDKGKQYPSLRIVSDSLGAIALASSASLTLRVDSLLPSHPNGLFVYRQDDRTKQWTQLATKQTGNVLTATVTNLGTFAIAYHTDTKDPVIDMTVEGQLLSQPFDNNGKHLTPFTEVDPTPRIQAVLQDANGIDIRPGKTVVKIDGKASEYTMLDSGRTTTTASLRITPTLSEGDHMISIQGTDNNGRTSSDSIIVHASNSFSIGVLGSFPNPFTKEYMFIAYEIRGIAFATQVSLDIYTVAGRRVRSMTFPSNDPTRSFGFLKGGTGVPTSIGYHEAWWDGRDDNGDEVANGVYYYRFSAQTPSDTREIKGKFARLR